MPDSIINPSAKPITIHPYSRQRVVCGARADLALEGPARNGTITNITGEDIKVCWRGYMELKKLEYDLTVCKVEMVADMDITKDFFFIGKTD